VGNCRSALWLNRVHVTSLVDVVKLVWELTWHTVKLVVPHQEHNNWCWAATSNGVAHCYNPGSTWTQCAIANANLGRTDCCGSGGPGPCNVYGYLDKALAAVGHYDHMAAQVASFPTIEGQINGGRPVGVRVAWSGGGAHFVAVGGYRDIPGPYVHVEDPWYGPSDVAYSTLVSGYQTTGSWTHTYWTKP